jgi:hypothetical protein
MHAVNSLVVFGWRKLLGHWLLSDCELVARNGEKQCNYERQRFHDEPQG